MRKPAKYAVMILICVIGYITGCSNTVIPDQTTIPGTTDITSTVTQPTTVVTTTKAVQMMTTASYTELEKLLLNIYISTGSKQLIISFQTEPEDTRKGLVFAYEIIDNARIRGVFKDIPVVYGRNGLDKEAEGDGRAPSGIFKIPFAFGTTEFEIAPSIEYRLTTENDYWVDDTGSDDYNSWQTYEGDPKSQWRSFERLKIDVYRLAFVIGYNEEREKGLGSAIFFHVWKNEDTYTSGCTAASFEDVKALISWLDADKNPVIIQGGIEYFWENHDIDIWKETADDPF